MSQTPTAPIPGQAVCRAASALPAKLTHANRCDSCGAQAYVAALFHGRPLALLFFCGHHFTRWERTIRETAVGIHDERWRLTAEVGAQKKGN